MAKWYTPGKSALLGTAVCLLVSVIILFTAPYIGMGNDSIGNKKMQEYGLAYRNADVGGDWENFAANEYFTKNYEMTQQGEPIHTAQNAPVKLAMILDRLFTRGNLFDVRFLALVYLILYLPGVYLVLRAAAERVSYFSEAVVLTALGTLIFSDISYIAFFNSLYPDALEFICLLYISGSGLMMQKERKQEILMPLILTASGAVLCLTEKKFFIAGLVTAVLLMTRLRVEKETGSRVMVGVLSLALIACSVFGFFWSGEEFDETAKFHAMSRGVLLESRRPDRTLEEMNIDVSYSVLADQSLYDSYPVSEISNPVLQEGFLNQYTMSDVLLFYVRNPGAMISMWDNGIKAALNLRREYCGNYERSTGMPPMGKSIFWSSWSVFKSRSLPNTIGYLAVLIAAYFITSGGKVFNRRAVQRWDLAYFAVMTAVVAIGICDLTYVICASGDAQMIQYNMVFGTALDILLFYTVAELLHKLNILEGKNADSE